MLLLRRATHGPTPAALAEIDQLGPGAWLEQQLAPQSLADPDGNAVTALYPELSYTPTRARQVLPAFDGTLLYGFVGHTIGRAIWSRRQLHEVMVGFWSDHLHIPGMFWDSWDSRHRYDLDIIRPHALGRFATMLQAAVRHLAMLKYLDQNNSRATRLNENLGRELLELHTVGAGTHTEADMLASSRLLTGLSIDSNGEFTYRTDYHHVGALTVLGRTFANGSANGQATVTEYLDFLARHPATAQRIARKLVARFVSDTPPEALVGRLAAIYLGSDTDIVPVLRALFTSAEFAASAGQKLRTPQEDVYAMVRVLGHARPTTREELLATHWALAEAGHGVLDWLTPDGFPQEPTHWANPATALARMNLHMNVAGNWWPKFSGYPTGSYPLRVLLGDTLPPTHADLVQTLAQRVLFTTLDQASLNAVLEYLGRAGTDPVTASSAAITWRLSYLVALLFDTPAHTIR